MNKMIISERIFELLKIKGISQKEFSKLTGISQSTISDWKTKKTNPAADKIKIICNVLELTPTELLEDAEVAELRQPDHVLVKKGTLEYLLLEKFRKLDENAKIRLQGYLQALSENDA